MTIQPNRSDYYRIRFLARSMELVEAQLALANVTVDRARETYIEAAKELGLDPGKYYHFNDEDGTLTEVTNVDAHRNR